MSHSALLGIIGKQQGLLELGLPVTELRLSREYGTSAAAGTYNLYYTNNEKDVGFGWTTGNNPNIIIPSSSANYYVIQARLSSFLTSGTGDTYMYIKNVTQGKQYGTCRHNVMSHTEHLCFTVCDPDPGDVFNIVAYSNGTRYFDSSDPEESYVHFAGYV